MYDPTAPFEEIETYPDYSLSELEEMPTIEEGYTCDLKLETFNTRVWLARTRMEDGEPCDDKVTIESLVSGRWVEAGIYQARD